MNFKSVTKQEMYDFIRSYPNQLARDVAMMFEPPYITFNDFTTGKVWPDSIVASYTAAYDDNTPACNFQIKEQ